MFCSYERLLLSWTQLKSYIDVNLLYWTSTFYGSYSSQLICLPPMSKFLQLLNWILKFSSSCCLVTYPFNSFCLFGLIFWAWYIILASLISMIIALAWISDIIMPLTPENGFLKGMVRCLKKNDPLLALKLSRLKYDFYVLF